MNICPTMNLCMKMQVVKKFVMEGAVVERE